MGIKKIKRLYPIYFITLILSIIIIWDWVSTLDLKQFIYKFLLNLTLVQSCFKNEALNFNPLSWFLSVLFIIYFFTIPIIKFIKRINLKNAIVFILITLFLRFSINISKRNIFTNINLYSSPVYRITEFILGALAAKVFMEKKHDLKMRQL